MKNVVDFETGETIGCFLKYKNDSGPCIYGASEFVSESSNLVQRILAAISSRESPIRSKKNPTKVQVPLAPGYSSVQAYEPWISLGMCHAISRNGNAQRLVQSIVDQSKECKDKLLEYGYSIENNIFKTDKGVALSQKEVRSERFCVAIHKMLENPVTIPIQCNFFWGLIKERFPIVKDTGWWDALMADERVLLIVASLSINAGTSLFRKILENAEEYTADSLTKSRIKEYKRIGSNFGVERANWERKCKYVVDGQQVVGI